MSKWENVIIYSMSTFEIATTLKIKKNIKHYLNYTVLVFNDISGYSSAIDIKSLQKVLTKVKR